MFINATGFYVPEERVDNQHFLELNGLTSEWIEQRTGIHTRSKAKEEENINTMSLEAVKDALPKLPYDITEVDLIVSASYSPYDTVATAAHTVQHEYTIADAKALYLSSACSSFLKPWRLWRDISPWGRLPRLWCFPLIRTPLIIMRQTRRRAIYGVMPPPLSLSPRSGSVRATPRS